MDFVAVVIVDRVVVGLAMIRGGYSSGQSKGCTQGKAQGNGEHGVDFGFDSDDVFRMKSVYVVMTSLHFFYPYISRAKLVFVSKMGSITNNL